MYKLNPKATLHVARVSLHTQAANTALGSELPRLRFTYLNHGKAKTRVMVVVPSQEHSMLLMKCLPSDDDEDLEINFTLAASGEVVVIDTRNSFQTPPDQKTSK